MNAIGFGSSAKTKMATIKRFNMYAIDTHCERDIFIIISPINFKFDVIPPKGRTLLILGHLLKPRWPPLNF